MSRMHLLFSVGRLSKTARFEISEYKKLVINLQGKKNYKNQTPITNNSNYLKNLIMMITHVRILGYNRV